MLWWHKWRHHVTFVKVSVPIWDPWGKGHLYECKCGKIWAK